MRQTAVMPPAETESLKSRIRADLATSMKARDTLTTGTLRLLLTEISRAEVAGEHAVRLTDEQVVAVVTREVRKRNEARDAFTAGDRPESAAKEAAEADVLRRYLPAPLGDAELASMVAAAVAEAQSAGLSGGRAMGAVMKSLTPRTSGRADGAVVAQAVKQALGL